MVAIAFVVKDDDGKNDVKDINLFILIIFS